MRIIININLLTRNPADAYAGFIYQLLLNMVKKYNEHDFVFVSQQPLSPEFVFEKRVLTVVAGPTINHRFQHRYWFDIKLPLLLKKQKADFFISPDGSCSFSTRIPQCVMLPDLSYIHSSNLFTKTSLFFLNRRMEKTVNKAATIITLSTFSKSCLLTNYPGSGEKIFSINGATSRLFRPLSEAEKEQVKSTYSQNKNYFICVGSSGHFRNTTNLLKAFSVFKKRQKSNWKLILASSFIDKKVTESLRAYKYRDDVITISVNEENQLASLIGSAYGLINPSLREDHSILLCQAFQCSIPVVAASGSAWEEKAGDSILYANMSDYQDIADKMMLLYKNETLRSGLIAKARANTAVSSGDNTAEQVWKCVMEAMR